jgi:hypothetical protein
MGPFDDWLTHLLGVIGWMFASEDTGSIGDSKVQYEILEGPIGANPETGSHRMDFDWELSK